MKILVFGGDKRMIYAASELGADKIFLGENTAFGKYDAVVLPCPLSREKAEVLCPLDAEKHVFGEILPFAEAGAAVFAGGRTRELEDICRENSLSFYNYLESEALTLRNAALTAEAAASLLQQSTDGSIFGSSVLITGYGRISRALSRILRAMGAAVTVTARSAENRALAEIEGFRAVGLEDISREAPLADFIVNTVPALVFSGENLSGIGEGCVFMELAPVDEQPVRSVCESASAKYIRALALPGKYSPEAAGKLIAREILDIIREKQRSGIISERGEL